MRLISSDGERSIVVGGSDIWHSLYSTALAMPNSSKSKIMLAVKFMEEKECNGEDGYEIARQFNLLRDEFSRIPPEKAVYDINDKKKNAPWSGHLSPVITSCANLYTTADGKDLLFEIVSILCYAQVKRVKVSVE